MVPELADLGFVTKTLSTKTTKFWYFRYIPILAKDQEPKIVEVEDKVLMYTVSKLQPQIHYILGDMIPQVRALASSTIHP